MNSEKAIDILCNIAAVLIVIFMIKSSTNFVVGLYVSFGMWGSYIGMTFIIAIIAAVAYFIAKDRYSKRG